MCSVEEVNDGTDGVDKIQIRKASYHWNNGALEIAMFAACHLVDLRYSIEVTDANLLVLDMVMNINLVVSQQYLAPFKWVIEKELVSVV